MIVETAEQPRKRGHKQEEARLQADCFRWCWNSYPETRRLLFHVENERTNSSMIDGARRRSMGLVAGVSDLILLIPRGRWHGLCIEMKTIEGKQRDEQKLWQAAVESQGYRYELIRTKQSFQQLIEEYLALPH